MHHHSTTHALSRVRKDLGYCPQQSALPFKLTGREAVRLYARLRGVRPAAVESVVEALLQKLDLLDHADRWASHVTPVDLIWWTNAVNVGMHMHLLLCPVLGLQSEDVI